MVPADVSEGKTMRKLSLTLWVKIRAMGVRLHIALEIT